MIVQVSVTTASTISSGSPTVCVVIGIPVHIGRAGAPVIRTEILSVVHDLAVGRTTLTVSRRARHHTTVLTVTIVTYVTIAGRVTATAVILVVAVTVVTHAGTATRASTVRARTALITTMSTKVLALNCTVVTVVTIVAGTPVRTDVTSHTTVHTVTTSYTGSASVSIVA